MGHIESSDITAVIGDYVSHRVPALARKAINADTPLLASGLDSLGILELTMFLSEKYGIELTEEDFQADHFESIGSLVAFVEQRIAT